jgi:hypothetical protein
MQRFLTCMLYLFMWLNTWSFFMPLLVTIFLGERVPLMENWLNGAFAIAFTYMYEREINQG